jgi:putative membrane protein
MLIMTPYTLLLTGTLVLYYTLKNGELKILVWCLIIYIITFTLEILGTKTGIIFGSYTYGDTLGLKLSGVPLIIGFNWVIVILGAIQLAERIDKNIFLTALLTGTFAVLFDLMLEPVALKLNYWEWSSGLIPLSNYYSWFGISFVASLLYDFLHIKANVKMPEFYFIIQLIFFILLSLFI